MLGGLYGDLPPPSQSTSSSSAPPEAAVGPNDESQQKKPLRGGAMPVMMPPAALRKASGILAPPPSVLRNQGAAKPKPAVKTAPDREFLRPSLSPPPVTNQLVAANSCVVDEYDPTRPNDYEEYCRERRRRKMEEEVRRDLERRRQEEEEKERNSEPERPKEIEMHISGDEAWKRRAMLSASAGNRAGESPPSPPRVLEDHKQKNPQGGGGGMSAAQRMMARMGWKEGQGLGKQEQGITTPLVARKTDKRAGVIVNAREFKKQKPVPAATPTRVILLRNMVGPGEVDAELEEEVASECGKYGNVTSVLIYEIIEQDYNPMEAVRIFVQFERVEQATKALADLDGRFFGGRVVKGSYFDEERFTRNELAPLAGEN